MPSPRAILPVDRWSLLVLVTAFAALALVVWLDALTSWTLLLFYLVPVIVVASMVRGYWWLVTTLIAITAWYIVRVRFPGTDALVQAQSEPLGYSLMVRLGMLLLVGFLCSRLREYSRSPGSFSSSHDSTGLLSAGGLEEAMSRRLIADRFAQGPVALLLLSVDRRVSAYAGQSNEYAALVGAMIGKVVLDHARAADLCVRLSPSHFLILMPGADPSAAATLDAAIQNTLPEVTRSLDDSVSVATLLLVSQEPVADINAMRSYAETRLTTLKVLGAGKNHSETWPPAAPPTYLLSGSQPSSGFAADRPLTAG